MPEVKAVHAEMEVTDSKSNGSDFGSYPSQGSAVFDPEPVNLLEEPVSEIGHPVVHDVEESENEVDCQYYLQ